MMVVCLNENKIAINAQHVVDIRTTYSASAAYNKELGDGAVKAVMDNNTEVTLGIYKTVSNAETAFKMLMDAIAVDRKIFYMPTEDSVNCYQGNKPDRDNPWSFEIVRRF